MKWSRWSSTKNTPPPVLTMIGWRLMMLSLTGIWTKIFVSSVVRTWTRPSLHKVQFPSTKGIWGPGLGIAPTNAQVSSLVHAKPSIVSDTDAISSKLFRAVSLLMVAMMTALNKALTWSSLSMGSCGKTKSPPLVCRISIFHVSTNASKMPIAIWLPVLQMVPSCPMIPPTLVNALDVKRLKIWDMRTLGLRKYTSSYSQQKINNIGYWCRDKCTLL